MLKRRGGVEIIRKGEQVLREDEGTGRGGGGGEGRGEVLTLILESAAPSDVLRLIRATEALEKAGVGPIENAVANARPMRAIFGGSRRQQAAAGGSRRWKVPGNRRLDADSNDDENSAYCGP